MYNIPLPWAKKENELYDAGGVLIVKISYINGRFNGVYFVLAAVKVYSL